MWRRHVCSGFAVGRHQPPQVGMNDKKFCHLESFFIVCDGGGGI